MYRDEGGAKVPPEVRKKMEEIAKKQGVDGKIRFRKVPRATIDRSKK